MITTIIILLAVIWYLIGFILVMYELLIIAKTSVNTLRNYITGIISVSILGLFVIVLIMRARYQDRKE